MKAEDVLNSPGFAAFVEKVAVPTRFKVCCTGWWGSSYAHPEANGDDLKEVVAKTKNTLKEMWGDSPRRPGQVIFAEICDHFRTAQEKTRVEAVVVYNGEKFWMTEFGAHRTHYWVEWVVSMEKITGIKRAYLFSSQGDKIIFPDKAEKQPAKGEYWLCVLRDTQPDNPRRGAFIARRVGKEI